MSPFALKRKPLLAFFLILAIPLPLYLATLQRIPNGSENYYMIDVGEAQIVLNVWGTLHFTGYPLYVIIGNTLVTLLKALGVAAVAAPGITSLLYGMVALALVYTLLSAKPTLRELRPVASPSFQPSATRQRPILAAAVVVLFGLTRTVWVHNAVAEVYSFGLMILALLLLIALWPGKIRGRVYWLALIGGIGVFHHRALIMAAPALVYAVWPEVKKQAVSQQPSAIKRLMRLMAYGGTLLALGLVGFLPYVYLPLRANAGAKWVYGEPGTWNGFLDQFFGREADHFIGLPATLDGLLANFNKVNTVLVTDLTVPGLVLGLLGLLLALRNPARRRMAITLLLSGGAAYVFHVLLYEDILSALILPITLSLALGWLLLGEIAFSYQPSALSRQRVREVMVFGVMAAFGGFLISQNFPFVSELTSNSTGLQTIALAQEAPPGSAMMLDWGPRHYAVGFAHDVLDELPNITLYTDKADFKSIAARQELVTADFTFYNRPVSWWEQKLGARVYLRAAAAHLVQIDTQPELASNVSGDGIQVENATLECTPEAINLRVDWLAASQPERDLSVFVHVLDASGVVIAQGDEFAPVYGWRPLTSWEAGEIVRDIYPLPRLGNATKISYGLYYQAASGEFVNVTEHEMAVACGQ